MRITDNRNLSDMEEWYLARIEALQAELKAKQQFIELLLSGGIVYEDLSSLRH